MAEVSFYLDTRRKKKNGTYPLKLYLYISRKVERWYPINVDLTEENYHKSYLSPRPRGEFRELKDKLEAIKVKADMIVEKMGEDITFEKFERMFYQHRGATDDVFTHYQEYIANLKKQGRAGNADICRSSCQSLREFIVKTKGKQPSKLTFRSITPEFLTEYEKWFVSKGAGQSRTTVGIYLRALRSIFNAAINAGDISKDIYPFTRFKIPTGKNVKKALDKNILSALYTAEVVPGSPAEKARDFWFFVYQCNGMNPRDIAELKWKNIKDTSFSFIRHKTQHTTKDDPRPIIVPMTEIIRSTIKKYGIAGGSNDYVFQIFTREMDEEEKLRKSKNFIRYINQHVQKLADKLELGVKINTLAARHSFTTNATRKSGSLTFAQEALGHKTLATTQNYWAGFEDEVKFEIANDLMKF